MKIIKEAFTGGHKFTKEIEIPILRKKINLDIIIVAKSPTKFQFTPNKDIGKIEFEPGIQVQIPGLSITSTLKSIELTEKLGTINLAGFPAINFDLEDLKKV